MASFRDIVDFILFLCLLPVHFVTVCVVIFILCLCILIFILLSILIFIELADYIRENLYLFVQELLTFLTLLALLLLPLLLVFSVISFEDLFRGALTALTAFEWGICVIFLSPFLVFLHVNYPEITRYLI